MQDAHPSSEPQVFQSRLLLIVRRVFSVVLGLVSVGLMALLWNVREGFADDWEAGFGWLYVIQGLLAASFGAGAVVLWFPKGRSGPWRRIMLGTVAALIVVAGVVILAAD